MREKYWDELNEIFLSNEELQKKYSSLFKTVTLVVELNKKHDEIDKLNKELSDLNK